MNSFKKNTTFEKNQKKENSFKTKIFFDNQNMLNSEKSKKIFATLLRKLKHTSYMETLLYSSEGIYELDENNNKFYILDYIDAETEKITIFNNEKNNNSFTVFCDYGIVNKIETFKFPIQSLKMKKCCYVFSNPQNSSLKLVIEKNLVNDEIIDFYCVLEKNLKFKDNANFYEELKEYNNLIFNV
jgi:hypothetical protein